MSLGSRIKERRLALGYTQEELANKVGLQKSAIAKYENGRVTNIKHTILVKMATALECCPAYLMDFTDSLQEVSVEKSDFSSLQTVLDVFDFRLEESVPALLYSVKHKNNSDLVISLKPEEVVDMLYDISDFIYGIIGDKVHNILLNANRSYGLNAARSRTDVPITDADAKHDEDIMDDENF